MQWVIDGVIESEFNIFKIFILFYNFLQFSTLFLGIEFLILLIVINTKQTNRELSNTKKIFEKTIILESEIEIIKILILIDKYHDDYHSEPG